MKLLPKWWRRYFLLVELLLTILVTIIFIIWYEWFRGEAFLCSFLCGNRAAIYGTAASIFGSLLGFAITASSIVLGFSASDRLRVIRESKQYNTLWQVFSSTIRALALATISSFISLIFDRDTHPVPLLLFFALFGAVLAFFRVWRTIWVLENVIALITMPSKQSHLPTDPL
jgi:hypothetical protein